MSGDAASFPGRHRGVAAGPEDSSREQASVPCDARGPRRPRRSHRVRRALPHVMAPASPATVTSHHARSNHGRRVSPPGGGCVPIPERKPDRLSKAWGLSAPACRYCGPVEPRMSAGVTLRHAASVYRTLRVMFARPCSTSLRYEREIPAAFASCTCVRTESIRYPRRRSPTSLNSRSEIPIRPIIDDTAIC